MVLPDIASVVERARKSVVSVVAEVVSTDIFGGRQRGFQSGSGVIFDDQGHILTNNHVVEGSTNVVVTLDNGQKLGTSLVGTDPLTDLAVLKVDDTTLPHVGFADPASVRVGDWVIAIGNALALPGGPTVTVGIVSARDRSFQVDQNVTLYDLIQTDTIINPGNSGGPLLNLSGEIVGINTAAVRGERVEGIGFAVGGETAILVSRELIGSGKVGWPWLGVMLSDLDAEQAAQRTLPVQQGILVQEVLQGGPASQGGLKAGDVILSASGHNLPTIRDLTHVLRFSFRVGDVVNIEVLRDGAKRTVRVVLGERPPT
jgi:S1-C subfamily serine protease